MISSICLSLISLNCGSSPPNTGYLAATEYAQATPGTGTPPSRTRPAPAPKTTSPTASAGPLIAVPPGGLSINDARYRRLYGPGLYIMDALADLNVGVVKGFNYIAAHRFRASAAGKVSSVRVYWPAGPGYSAGNGGTISIRILPDDGTPNHLPAMNASPLAAGTYTPGLLLGRHVFSSFNDEVRLGSMTPLVAGQLYHVVYENVDPEPAKNYIGINNMVTVERNGRPARWLDPIDWASLFAFRAVNTPGAYTWKDATRTTNAGLFYSPILQINLQDGAVIGAVDIETGNVEGERQWSINAQQSIRERFAPTSDRSISGFSVQTATTSGGELEWSLRDGEQVVLSGVIKEAGINYGSQFNVNLNHGIFSWYDIALPSSVTLKKGTPYDLVFTPKGGSQWRFADEYNGSDKGFAVSFSESQAQALVAGKWVNVQHRKHITKVPASNWRVVLHLAP